MSKLKAFFLAQASYSTVWRLHLAQDRWIARRDPRGQFGWMMTRAAQA